MPPHAPVDGQVMFAFTSTRPFAEKEALLRQFRLAARRQNWKVAVINEVELILEEWITNLIYYGLIDSPAPLVSVAVTQESDLAEIRVCDNGHSYDPRKHTEPDVTLPLDQREIGGLGIFMMKRLASGLDYESCAGENCLIIRKDLSKPVLPQR